jgi:hypothetical protein
MSTGHVSDCKGCRWLGALALLCVASGCSTVPQTNQAVATAAVLGSSLPSFDLEQVFYLGSFDPAGQLPPTLYRIRVRGQASFLNITKFASSWVPAEVVDALTGSLKLDSATGNVKIERDDQSAGFNVNDSGRRLVQFGPEGFRTAPKGHRLVILMGSSPEKVEQAFASALGSVASAKSGESGNAVDRKALATLLQMHKDKGELQELLAKP